MCIRRIVPFLVAAVLAPVPAIAGVNVGAGLVDEIDGESSRLLTLAYTTRHRHPWEFMLGHIVGRDGGLDTPDVDYVAASRQFGFGRWFVSGGVAYTDSDSEVLSRHWQFLTGVGWRNERFSLSLRHLSNGNTGGRNRGETFLLAEYRF